MRFDPRALLGTATGYAAQHDAPDFDRMIGNPTWRQRFAYVKKTAVHVLNVAAVTNIVEFVPSPANFYVASGVALLGWVVGYQVKNGPQPPVKDSTGWVANSVPPKSEMVPPTEDIETGLTGAEDVVPPTVSETDADAEVAAEDAASVDEPEEPPTPRELGS